MTYYVVFSKVGVVGFTASKERAERFLTDDLMWLMQYHIEERNERPRFLDEIL